MPGYAFTKTHSVYDPLLLKKAVVSPPQHAEPEVSKASSAAALLHKFIEAHRALESYKWVFYS